MADNRYRERGQGRSDSIFGDERGYGYGGSREHERGGRGGDDRGFFQRAGEEVMSWFSDDDRRDQSSGRESGYGQRSDYGRYGSGASGQSGRHQDYAGSYQRSYGGSSGGDYGSQGRGQSGGDYHGQPQSWGQANEGQSWRGGSSSYGGSQGSQGSQGGQMGQSGRGGYAEGRSEPWGGGSDWSSQSYGRERGHQSEQRGGSSPFDQHYRSWRDQQISQLDREYDDYCKHRQQQFESDFQSWRQGRQGQSGTTGQSGLTGQSGTTSGRTGMGGQSEGSGTTTGMTGGGAAGSSMGGSTGTMASGGATAQGGSNLGDEASTGSSGTTSGSSRSRPKADR